jgi:signal transduction histidine kinase
LQRSQDQLRGLAAKLNAAREAERRHLARELHDELGQTLTSLKLELLRLVAMVDWSRFGVSTLDRVQSLIGLTEISLETTRRLATDLRPPMLDHLGLAEAIRWEVSVVQARTGIRCRSVVRGKTPTLDDDRATGVFRIFQEALTNVVRHAEASVVRIELHETGKRLVLSVKDNGRGITRGEKADRASIGLVGMRERARMLGGTIDLSGKKGKGTTVVLRIPTKAKEA